MSKNFPVAFLFVVLLFVLGCRSRKISHHKANCPPIVSFRHGVVSCRSAFGNSSCNGNFAIGSLAEFKCHEYYQLEGRQRLKCLLGGTWSSQVPECVPDCGRSNSMVRLIVNGFLASPDIFPWHVAIYNFIDGEYEFWCGGSLISEFAVLTAAHCTWNVHPENLHLAFGKFTRAFNAKEKNVEKRRGRKVEMLESYQDSSGNYNGDLSVIFLDKGIPFGLRTRPICLDWAQRHVDKQLTQGNMGVVLGWGLTERETFSDVLRILRLPVVSDERCIAQQAKDFKKFITYTSFCAGFGNGTGVCNGDSGGGLAFLDEESDRWYLQGLVSVSPRRTGTPYCDPKFYTVFTKVSVFTVWLKKIQEMEKVLYKGRNKNDGFSLKEETNGVYAFISKFFEKEGVKTGSKSFPHSPKMLELLDFIDKRNKLTDVLTKK